jgi:hypothetical protein
MQKAKKKCGGSPEEVEVIFYLNLTDIFMDSYNIRDVIVQYKIRDAYIES